MFFSLSVSSFRSVGMQHTVASLLPHLRLKGNATLRAITLSSRLPLALFSSLPPSFPTALPDL